MPELPEVQTVVSELIKQRLVGATVTSVVSFWQKSIAEPNVETFCQRISGQKIRRIERRGKYILIVFEGQTLFIHLRMSGRLLLGDDTLSRHERARFLLSDGRILKFIDQRKFGRLHLLKDPSDKLGQLGVDPTSLEFTLPQFVQLLQRRKKIKSLLLDQTIISGIGNIYADEALWEARIHPETQAFDLVEQEALALYQAIRQVLQSAIANQGTSLGASLGNFHGLTGQQGRNATQLAVYQRSGSPCHRCSSLITRITLNGRGTHYCTSCQRKAVTRR